MAKNKVSEPTSVKTVRQFNKDQLRAHSQELFGVTPVVFDGALFNIHDKITKEEAKNKINAWLEQKVSVNSEEDK